jgi:hypothetical protein
MGGKTPETCWDVNKRQDNKLKNCCIWLVIYLKWFLNVCLSVCLSAWNNSAATGRTLLKFDISVFFQNLSGKFKLHFNRLRIRGTLPETNVHCWSYLAQFFLEWEIFQTEFVNKIKTHILCSITYFRKSCRLWDNVKKYSRAGQATDYYILRRMRFACWMTKARHKLRIYNTYSFGRQQ